MSGKIVFDETGSNDTIWIIYKYDGLKTHTFSNPSLADEEFKNIGAKLFVPTGPQTIKYSTDGVMLLNKIPKRESLSLQDLMRNQTDYVCAFQRDQYSDGIIIMYPQIIDFLKKTCASIFRDKFELELKNMYITVTSLVDETRISNIEPINSNMYMPIEIEPNLNIEYTVSNMEVELGIELPNPIPNTQEVLQEINDIMNNKKI